MSRMTISEAIVAAIRSEMQRDESVYLMGQDIGVFGGPMQSSKGLWDEFGAARLIDAPISEAAMVGTAVGAAMAGGRPIVDLMFAEFLALTMTPLGLEGASIGFKSNGRVGVPVVVRAKCGVGPHRGHAESLVGMLMAFPGLAVIMPTTPQDAYSLTVSAIRANQPVVLLEHMSLLHGARAEVDTDLEIPLGSAQLRREGADLTIVTAGLMVSRSLRAAEQLASDDGINASVIDLRSYAPLDVDTVLAEATRSGAVLISEEAWPTSGPASELAAGILRRTGGQGSLRFGFIEPPANTPIPFGAEMERAYVPSVEDIADAARRLCGRGELAASHFGTQHAAADTSKEMK